MFKRRKLFVLAGVSAVDLDEARRDSLEVVMHRVEQATRDAVHDAAQTVIGARVAPADICGEVFVDIRLSGDRAGAIAAALGAVTGAAIGEYAMRSLRGRERPKDAH
jgi:uncharacterized protein YcfJ